MPPKGKTPLSPRMPKSPKAEEQRPSLEGLFGDLGIGSSKGKERARVTSGVSMSSTSSMRDSFAQQWPPSFGFGSSVDLTLDSYSMSSVEKRTPSRSLRMSDSYRNLGDRWAQDHTISDVPLDKSEDFAEIAVIMDEIHAHCEKLQEYRDGVADFMVEEMGRLVFGSNRKAQKCMDLQLDEILKLCEQIFAGDAIEYSERTPEYQAKMEKLIRQGIDAAPDHVIRSRRELVQHAAAFHYIIRRFVHEKAPLTEDLLQETHEILVAGIGAGSAGFLSNKEHGGLYRTGNVFVGSQKAPPANKVAESMASLVRKLEANLAEAKEEKKLDPFALAAKYCSMLVYIHPFQDVDANGRMCRLILNSIPIRYAGIVVSLGEHDQSRDEYTETATESRAVVGHHGALGTMVLQEAKNTLKRIKDKLSKIKK